MTEEQTLIENIRIQFISPVPDLKEKKNDAQWRFGYITITNQKVILIPEKNNATVKAESITIPITDIADVDRRVELWRKILGTNRILPIDHKDGTNEVVSLIATSNETVASIKNLLLLLVVSGTAIEFVCLLYLGLRSSSFARLVKVEKSSSKNNHRKVLFVLQRKSSSYPHNGWVKNN